MAAPAALAQPAVAVFPSPSTNSALPQTQITFRGIPASQIGHVTVVGSSSGAHSGTIEADSDGQGGSFIPSTPFTAGETVTVTTGLNVINGTNGSFHFGDRGSVRDDQSDEAPDGPGRLERRPALPLAP